MLQDQHIFVWKRRHWIFCLCIINYTLWPCLSFLLSFSCCGWPITGTLAKIMNKINEEASWLSFPFFGKLLNFILWSVSRKNSISWHTARIFKYKEYKIGLIPFHPLLSHQFNMETKWERVIMKNKMVSSKMAFNGSEDL